MKCTFSAVQCLENLTVIGRYFEKWCYIEMAEKRRDENLGTLQDNHNEYLKIIDDLSTDLNTLSCQVNMVQSEFLNDEIADQFEGSLKGLETQNDLLQAAIDNLIGEKETIEKTLNTKNEELKNTVCQLEHEIRTLRNIIEELQRKQCGRCKTNEELGNDQQRQSQRPHRTSSDEKLEQIENELKWKCKTVEKLKCENANLQMELADIRRNQAKIKLLQRREATPDRTSNQQELIKKLNAAQEKNLEQCQLLQKASKQIACLQNEIEDLQGCELVYLKERDLLQTQLTALKENEASQMGIQQSLKEQLQMTTHEVYVAKEKLNECNQEKDNLYNILNNERKRFQETINGTKEHYNKVVDEFNVLVEENKKLIQINHEKDKILEAYDTWKEQQIHIENEMRQKTQLFEQHFKEMLENNQMILDRLNETENNNMLLRQALENSRQFTAGNQSSIASGSMRGYKTLEANSNNDPVSKVIENIRHTSRKLSQQRAIFQDEASNLSK